MLSDVKDLGVSFNNLYRTFSIRNIDAPPVWDSQVEKTRRKADMLRDAARRLGTNQLTKVQASQVLNFRPSRLSDALLQIRKRGFEYPEIARDDAAE